MATIDKIDALLQFINDTKPFSTKVLDVTVEYKQDETASVEVSDEGEVEVTRTNNDYDINNQPIALKWYLPYDRIQAFTYSEEYNIVDELIASTITQDKTLNSKYSDYDYVVAKVDIELLPEAVSSSPEYVPYVIFKIVDIDTIVDPADFAVGIIAIENFQTRLPCVDPENNRDPVGTFEFDVGYRANGTVLANDSITSLVNGTSDPFTTGDYIKIELDYFASPDPLVRFWNVNDPNVPVYLGEFVVPDTSKTYAFACSMPYPSVDATVSIVPPPPPPPFFNLLSSYQNQLAVCSSVNLKVEIEASTDFLEVPLFLRWTQVDPLTNIMLPNGHSDRVDLMTIDNTIIDTEAALPPYSFSINNRFYQDVHYDSPLHIDRKFKISIYTDSGGTNLLDSQFHTILATPTDNIEVSANISPDMIINSALSNNYPGSSIVFHGYNYSLPTSDPNTWYSSTITNPTNVKTLGRIKFLGPDFPCPAATSDLVKVVRMEVYKLSTTEYLKQLVHTAYSDGEVVTTPLSNGTYRVDTIYRLWAQSDDITVKGTTYLTVNNPNSIYNVCDVIQDPSLNRIEFIDFKDVIHYNLIQIEGEAIDQIVYAPNNILAQRTGDSKNHVDSAQGDNIAAPSSSRSFGKTLQRRTVGSIGG